MFLGSVWLPSASIRPAANVRSSPTLATRLDAVDRGLTAPVWPIRFRTSASAGPPAGARASRRGRRERRRAGPCPRRRECGCGRACAAGSDAATRARVDDDRPSPGRCSWERGFGTAFVRAPVPRRLGSRRGRRRMSPPGTTTTNSVVRTEAPAGARTGRAPVALPQTSGPTCQSTTGPSPPTSAATCPSTARPSRRRLPLAGRAGRRGGGPRSAARSADRRR